jgi:signal transduction histidine kinase
MAVIRGTVDLIRAKDKDNEKLSRYCTTIHEQVDRMVDLTRDVLDYSRGESRLAIADVPLAEYFGSVKSFHQEQFRAAAIDLSVEGPANIILRLDPNRFRRVVDNILNNAREALKPGDKVVLTWHLDPRQVVIEIADNGPGIPEKIKDTIFEPFVTSNKEGGTGLGLAIAKKIVDDHGGLIEVQSLPNQGTRFVIDLPITLAVGETAPNEVLV